MTQKYGAGLSLAILTTAIGATVAAPAHAALVSQAPTGFTPVTVTATSGSYTFDVDGNGSNDFTLIGNGTSVTLQYLDTARNAAETFATQLYGRTSASTLSIGTIKSGTTGTFTANFGTSAGEFVGLATNATFSGPGPGFFATGGTLGYLQGTYTDSAIPSFQLLDFGLVDPVAVPEPASLALLATGAAGIAALRRRRAIQGRAAHGRATAA